MNTLGRGLLITAIVFGGAALLAPPLVLLAPYALALILAFDAFRRIAGWPIALAVMVVVVLAGVARLNWSHSGSQYALVAIVTFAAAHCARYTPRGERRNWHPGEIDDRLDRVKAAHIRELEAERARADRDGQRSS